MSEITLGLSYGYHDSAAALLKDGRLLAAVQEERLTRVKADKSFPIFAIKEVLSIAGISLEEVTEVVFYEKPMLKFERILYSTSQNFPSSFKFFQDAMLEWIGKSKLDFTSFSLKQIKNPELRKEFSRLFSRVELKYSQHHLSHAASAFFPSGFTDAAVIVADAVGEYSSTSVWLGHRNNLKLIHEYKIPDSIGIFYSMVTSFLGFKPNSGEYKVMGLAPFGKPIYKEKLNELFAWNIISDDEFPSSYLNVKVINPVWSEEKNLSSIERHLGHSRRSPESPLIEYYADIAASLQAVTNEYMLLLANSAARITKAKNLVMAGGVALNCVSNEYVKQNGNFENIWIQPASGDAGGSIGAAYALQAASQTSNIQIEPIKDMYLGREFTTEEIKETLLEFGITLEEIGIEEVLDAACKDLGDNKIIGWFRGRCEFGPRALGNRSILGRADSSSMQVRMNLKIKFRESFRPFAPVVMSEYFDEYFEGERDPFMIRIARSRDFLASGQEIFDIRTMLDQQRSILQATTHLDGTARVQSVDKGTNPELHSLIENFRKLTGLPVLINTSFNTRGEPIVYSPRDALIAFARTEIDTLYVGNFIVRRTDITKNLKTTAEKVKFDAD